VKVNIVNDKAGVTRVGISGVLLAFLAMNSGCQESPGPKMEPVVPVYGKVLVDKRPAVGAMVMFHPLPVETGRFDRIRSRGTVELDGSFELTTYNTDDGAPEGEYAVTVYWPGQRVGPPDPNDEDSALPPDKLGLRYSNPTSTPLRATVTAPETQLEPFDLK